MTDKTIQMQKDRFEVLCKKHIFRNGLDELLYWLENDTDFYIAPASTRFHGAVDGGLCTHSMNVFYWAIDLAEKNGIIEKPFLEKVAICALFHDLCKVNTYKKEMKNVKVDGKWTQVEGFVRDEQFLFGGHGSKSVYLLSKFIQMTDEEASAINCHMSCWDGDTHVGQVYEKNHLAWLIHVADEAATFITESKGE